MAAPSVLASRPSAAAAAARSFGRPSRTLRTLSIRIAFHFARQRPRRTANAASVIRRHDDGGNLDAAGSGRPASRTRCCADAIDPTPATPKPRRISISPCPVLPSSICIASHRLFVETTGHKSWTTFRKYLCRTPTRTRTQSEP